MAKQTIGFHWGPAGLANGMWTGVRLRDLLEKAGYDRAEARHVEFVGGVPSFNVLLAVSKLLIPVRRQWRIYRTNRTARLPSTAPRSILIQRWTRPAIS